MHLNKIMQRNALNFIGISAQNSKGHRTMFTQLETGLSRVFYRNYCAVCFAHTCLYITYYIVSMYVPMYETYHVRMAKMSPRRC